MKKLFFLIALALGLGAQTQAQSCTEVYLTTMTDIWGSEVAWEVLDDAGQVWGSGAGFQSYSIETDMLCLTDGCYQIVMMDGFGDGWNGATLTAEYDGQVATYTLDQGNLGVADLLINVDAACDSNAVVFGCTDPEALNYNPDATVNDGSCEYPYYGCMDSTATNYNPWATVDDGSCVYPLECGEGEVLAEVYVCVFGNGANVAFELAGDDGSVVLSQEGYNNGAITFTDVCLSEGVCYTITASNLEGPFGWYGGYFWVNSGGMQLIQGEPGDDEQSASFIFSVDGTCGEVYGCTDPNADNYNPDATLDDGSCYTAATNDLCADAMPLSEGLISIDNTGAVQNEDIWGDCWSSGSGQAEESSLWFSFTTPDYPARILIEAMGDGTFTFTDTQFGLFTECGGEMIHCDGNSGEGLFSQFDFECGDLEENTEYLLVVDGFFGDSGTCLLSYSVNEECSDPVYGCTDPSAVNFDPNATVDNGTCIYQTDSCDNNLVGLVLNTAIFGSEVSFTVSDDAGNLVASFDGFDSNEEYYMSLCLDDGCYTIDMLDSWGDGWNGATLNVSVDGAPLVTGISLPQGSAMSFIIGVGVTDCSGSNEVYGCMDPEALNYNPSATMDDGSCVYWEEPECEAYFYLGGIDQEGDVVYVFNASWTNTEIVEYTWDWGDGVVTNGPFPTHVYNQGGDYIVCLSILTADSCFSTYCDTLSYDPGGMANGGPGGSLAKTSLTWTVNVLPEEANGLEDIAAVNALELFPVPAATQLNIRFEGDDASILDLRVTDLSGKLVMSERHAQVIGGNLIELQTSTLDEGVYLLEIISEGKRSLKRFEVMR